MTEDSWPERDLFGGPGRAPRDPRGRKRHRRLPQIAETVALLRAMDMTVEAIAVQVGLSDKTLTKYYSRELDKGPDIARAKMLERLYKAGMAGSVPAMKHYLLMCEKGVARQAWKAVDPEAEAASRPAALGKKEQAQLAAEKITGKFAPPEPPKLVVSNIK